MGDINEMFAYPQNPWFHHAPSFSPALLHRYLILHPLYRGCLIPAGSCMLRGAPSHPTPSECCRRSLLSSADTALTLLDPRILYNQSHTQVWLERYGA